MKDPGLTFIIGRPWHTAQWLQWLAILAAAGGALAWSAQDLQLSMNELIKGLPWMADLVSRMFPPNWGFMQRLMRPIFETVQLAVWGNRVRAELRARSSAWGSCAAATGALDPADATSPRCARPVATTGAGASSTMTGSGTPAPEIRARSAVSKSFVSVLVVRTGCEVTFASCSACCLG